MKRILRLLLTTATAALVTAGGAAQVDEPAAGRLSLAPDRIEIGMFYEGAEVRVEGEAPPDTDIVVVIRGPETEESFNKKVRAGPIWINSGQVHISGAPSVFLSYSSKPLDSFLPAETILRYQLTPEAAKRHMDLDAGGDVIDEDVIADNFITMKAGVNTYQVHNSGETALTVDDGRFTLDLAWPKTARPAVYEVSAYSFRDGEAIQTSTAGFEVVSAGAPAQIHDFAMNKSAQYGLLAVLLAVIAGFGIDFIVSRVFGSRAKAGH